MTRTVHATIAIVILGVILFAAVPGHAEQVKVVDAMGFERIDAFERGEVMYVSMSGLAEIIGGRLSWLTVGHQVSYVEGASRFVFLIGSPYVKIGDSTYNVVYPAEVRDGQLYLPVTTALPLLDRATPRKLTWLADDETIRVDSEFFNVTDISFQRRANGLLIEIFLTTALHYEAFLSEGNWVNVSIRDAKVNRQRILTRRDRSLLYDLSVHQIENGTGQVSFRLRRKIDKWHHKLAYDPPRIQISIADSNFEIPENTKPDILGPDDKIDVICVDAGHGGADYGAVGPKGTREKDIVLDIAKKLAQLIRKDKQFKVVMTRDRDETISLDDRAKIANDAGADLFISIHANASPKNRIRGWNVFFLAPALNDSARSVAQLENSFFLREMSAEVPEDPAIDQGDPLAFILSDMMMTEFQEESHDLALMIDKEFRRKLETPARGVDQAGFFVLNKVYTPSVLIESAFISNKKEEKLLKSSKYQNKLAQSLYEAIKRFKTKYESQ